MTAWMRSGALAALLVTAACARSSADGAGVSMGAARSEVERGRDTFRNDTFGDEAFWGGQLRLHEAIEGAAHGGVGPGVSPKTALAVGLKVTWTRSPAR